MSRPIAALVLFALCACNEGDGGEPGIDGRGVSGLRILSGDDQVASVNAGTATSPPLRVLAGRRVLPESLSVEVQVVAARAAFIPGTGPAFSSPPMHWPWTIAWSTSDPRCGEPLLATTYLYSSAPHSINFQVVGTLVNVECVTTAKVIARDGRVLADTSFRFTLTH